MKLALLALLLTLLVPATAGAQQRDDRHVSAISAHTLLHASAPVLVDLLRQPGPGSRSLTAPHLQPRGDLAEPSANSAPPREFALRF